MALYFAPSDSLNTCGLQSDSVYLPDWFTKLRLDKLELCKKFPVEESQPLVKFEKETLVKTLEMIWKKDDRIEEKLKNLPKLTGVDRKKSCSNCGKELPTSGKGSKKCSHCGSVYVKNNEKTTASNTTSELSPVERRVQFFSLFMKEGEKPDLKNVIHNHTVIPIRSV